MQIPRGKGETLRVGQIKTLTTEGTEHTEGEKERSNHRMVGSISFGGTFAAANPSFRVDFFRVFRAFRGLKSLLLTFLTRWPRAATA